MSEIIFRILAFFGITIGVILAGSLFIGVGAGIGYLVSMLAGLVGLGEVAQIVIAFVVAALAGVGMVIGATIVLQ